MANVTIKKAKLKDNMYLEVEYSETLKDGTNTVKKDCTAPVHIDLKHQFGRLSAHLALLTFQAIETTKKRIPVVDAENDAVYEDMPEMKLDDKNMAIALAVKCNGFTIGGSGDNEGVVLFGRRDLSNAKTLNLVSPFQKWYEDPYDYPYSGELSEIIEACRGEVFLYLFEGKHAPEAQLELFPEAEEQA